jgi:hypothetical protein
MPSVTIYFPDSVHREIERRIDDSNNTSQVVQELVLKGLKAEGVVIEDGI